MYTRQTLQENIIEIFSTNTRIVEQLLSETEKLNKILDEALDFFENDDIFNPQKVKKGIMLLLRVRNTSCYILLLATKVEGTRPLYEAERESVEAQIVELVEEKKKRMSRLRRILKRREPQEKIVIVTPKEVAHILEVVTSRIDRAMQVYFAKVNKHRFIKYDPQKDRDEIELDRAEVLMEVGKAISTVYSYSLSCLLTVASSIGIELMRSTMILVKGGVLKEEKEKVI